MNTVTLTKKDVQTILNKMKDVRVLVVGDVCLDLYWQADMTKSRLSRETPHFPLPVTEERASLGGGGNVMANVAALGAAVLPLSVLGADWRAYVTRGLFTSLGLPKTGLVKDAARVTPCYCKPLRRGVSNVVYEDPRLDFENDAPLSALTEARVLKALSQLAPQAQAVAVSDQLTCGVVTPRVRQALCRLGKTMPVVADSRDRIGLYTNVIVKPNEIEAAAAAECGPDHLEHAAALLSQKTGAPALVTLGEMGAIWCENGRSLFAPSKKITAPVDTVGAGDTFLAAFTAAYAAGEPGGRAAAFANLAAAVTVKKIGVTGTATPEEILKEV